MNPMDALAAAWHELQSMRRLPRQYVCTTEVMAIYYTHKLIRDGSHFEVTRTDNGWHFEVWPKGY